MEKRRGWQHLPAPLTSQRSIVEKSARLWRWSAGNARAVQGKVGAAHRSQPSTNPHHLPGFKSINSSIWHLAQFWTLLGGFQLTDVRILCTTCCSHLPRFAKISFAQRLFMKENPISNLITSKTSLHGLVFDMLIMSVLTVSAMKKVDNRSKEVASMGKTCEHILTVYMRCPELRNVTDTADISV